MRHDDDNRQLEAERLLKRVHRDSHDAFAGAFQRLLQLASPSSTQTGAGEDRIERWARRIGRTLGLIFAALLLLNLFTGWIF